MSVEVLSWLLAGEVLVIALIFSGAVYFFGGKKKDSEHKAVTTLLKKIKKLKKNRADDFQEFVELSVFDEASLEELLDEVHKKEVALYKHIVKIFLQKEASHLKSIDKHVSSLSEPYWSVIKGLASKGSASVLSDDAGIEEVRAALEIALAEKERLSNQLSTALVTLDEVSTEYSRMFSNPRDIEELQASKELVLEFYRQAINQTDKTEEDIPEVYEGMESI